MVERCALSPRIDRCNPVATVGCPICDGTIPCRKSDIGRESDSQDSKNRFNISALVSGTGLAEPLPERSLAAQGQAMINLTDSAVNAVQNAISGADKPVGGLRIMVEAGGCAGFKYMMGLVNEAEPDDTVIERDGVKVFVDMKSHDLLAGTTIDYVVALEGSGFTFENPNATSSCSCGKSFG
jgi:iron-sulfur cluster assembly accessory protein